MLAPFVIKRAEVNFRPDLQTDLQLASMPDRHRPGVVVFKKGPEGGLSIYGVQCEGVLAGRQRRVCDSDAFQPGRKGVSQKGVKKGVSHTLLSFLGFRSLGGCVPAVWVNSYDPFAKSKDGSQHLNLNAQSAYAKKRAWKGKVAMSRVTVTGASANQPLLGCRSVSAINTPL